MNRVNAKSYAIDIAMPIMTPAIIFSAFYHNTVSAFIVAVVVLLIASISIYKNYKIFTAVKGYILKVSISSFIFTATLVSLLLVPNTHDYIGGIFLYVCIPTWPIAFYLSIKSKEAKEVRDLWLREYANKI
jgi:hypothetical protein